MDEGALQSLTGKYRGLQGNPCNENRDPAMRTGFSLRELTHRKFAKGVCDKKKQDIFLISVQSCMYIPFFLWMLNLKTYVVLTLTYTLEYLNTSLS